VKVGLSGATGKSGGRKLKGLVLRGHRVAAIVRDPAKLPQLGPDAIALVDELDKPRYRLEQFSVGYDP
jgi:putative NADH-flavin reductase